MNKPTKPVTKPIRGSIKLDAPPMAFDAKLLASQSQIDPFVRRSHVSHEAYATARFDRARLTGRSLAAGR